MSTDSAAAELLDRVRERYVTAKSYRDSGEHFFASDDGRPGWEKRVARIPFRNIVARPSAFRLELGPGGTAAWSEHVVACQPQGAASPRIYGSLDAPLNARDDLLTQLIKIDLVTRGVGFPIALMFGYRGLGAAGLPNPESVTELSREALDGTDCWVIHVIDPPDRTKRWWIDAARLVVLRCEARRRIEAHTLRLPPAPQVSSAKDDQARAWLAFMIEQRSRGPAQAHMSQWTTRWHPEFDVEIDESSFAFTPPG